MVEETALGEVCRVADVVNARGGVALGAEDVQGRVKKIGFRFVL
jgi:hypothetical protein